MISYYCSRLHAHKHLCEECRQLNEYAIVRLEKCQFGNDKPTCKNCPVHCYAPKNREAIREVMRFSGPSMIYRHPVLAFYHLVIDSK